MWRDSGFVLTIIGFSMAFILFMYLISSANVDHRHGHIVECIRIGGQIAPCAIAF